MTGGSQTQTTAPSPMDLFNAKVIAQLAPYLMQKSAPGVAGINTADTAKANQASLSQGVSKASQMGMAPGSPQMFSLVDSMGKPGSVKKSADMMLLMYGKQPDMAPGGGSASSRPGLPDYMNVGLNTYLLGSKFNRNQGLDSTGPTPQYGNNALSNNSLPSGNFDKGNDFFFPKRDFGGGY